MPKVSIIIATHSRPNLLPRAVKSAQEAGTDVEVVVVDDASTDSTAEVCAGLEGIKYVRVDRNQRTAGARNIGIMSCSAPYVGFLDDDDWRLPGSIDKQVAILESDAECGLVYGQYLQADQGGEILDEPPQPQTIEEGDLFWKLLESNRFGCLTVIFRKDCLQRVGMLDPNFSGSDDWDLWVRIAEIATVRGLPEPVAVWRRAEPGTGQGSSDESAIYKQVAELYDAKLLKLPRVRKELGNDFDARRRQLMSLTSERIMFDAATRTRGRGKKLSNILAAVRIFPGRLLETSFYKAAIKTLMRDRSA